MNTYRVPYNQHKYADNSDTPKRAYKNILAIDQENAMSAVYDWRYRNSETGITTYKGNRYYIGLVFPESMELIK